MTVAVPYLIAAAAGVSAISAYSQGQAQAATQKSAAQADSYNAEVTRQNAAATNAAASAQEDQQRARARVAEGTQTASIAEDGIGFSGTGQDLIDQSNINSTLDALTIRYQGNMRARGLNNQAILDDYSGNVANQNASNAQQSGFFSAVGAAAGGASAYGQYQRKYGLTAGTNNTGYTASAPGVGTGFSWTG